MIDGVHVWRAALDGAGWPQATELPQAERERAGALLREQDARRWVASRWALRAVLGSYLGLAPAEIELELGEHGKPRLRGGLPLEFNLSHSEGLALVAVADRPVGVDVEVARPRPDLLALADRALPAAEADAVRAAAPSDREDAFYRAWTEHEARVKCLGAGLSTPPPEGSATVVPLELSPSYAAAVAAAGPEPFSPVCRSLEPGF